MLLNTEQVVFFVHLVFPTWAMQSEWTPPSYFFYNLVFLMVLLWGMHQQDSDNAINVVSILNSIKFRSL